MKKCKMRRWILLLLLTMVTIPFTVAQGTPPETFQPGYNHTMFTPVLDCNIYNYVIYNGTNNVTNGTLTAIEDGIYRFNFNLSVGDYIVRLCDNSTRELHVQEDENMYIALALFIMLSLAGYGFMGWYINKVRVDMENVNAMEGFKAVNRLKADMILKIVYLFLMNVMVLTIVGFAYYVADQISSLFSSLVFVYFIFSMTVMLVLVVAFIWKMFLFPFGVVGELLQNNAEKQKRYYRR